MKIAFITNESFPSGMATTNRILSLAKGLKNSGKNDVSVYCGRPTEDKSNPINTEREGVIDGISFNIQVEPYIGLKLKF